MIKLETIGQRIKYARFLASKSQIEVANQLGKGNQNALMSQWEKGTRDIRVADIIRLSEILDCEPSWLAFKEGDGPYIP